MSDRDYRPVRMLDHRDDARINRANALYEELRQLERDALTVRWREATGFEDPHGRQQMIAEIIEAELAGGEA
jgi:hypothetical protein